MASIKVLEFLDFKVNISTFVIIYYNDKGFIRKQAGGYIWEDAVE